MTAGRWLRFVAKELRETLRDKRTLATLVGMPLLLYPLLNVVVRQLLLGGARGPADIVHHVGLRTRDEAETLDWLLHLPGVEDEAAPPAAAPPAAATPLLPGRRAPRAAKFEVHFAEETTLRDALRSGELQARAGLDPPGRQNLSEPGGRPWRIALETLDGSPAGRDAAEALERKLAAARKFLLDDKLRRLGVPEGPEALAVERRTAPNPHPAPEGVPLAALLPLALALMTVTGAVYPAIDLTAGERERGTLEALMCTPAPKFAALSAKYVAVFAVAMLTGAVNLAALAVTVAASDLGPALFAPGALSWTTAALALGAMALYAAFFAAALLAVACFARSFKEAQAYLIPLMLLALAPGLASLLPGIALSPATAAVPLLNVVLLTRDLFRGEAGWAVAATVAAFNLLYAAAALAVAARAFGSESILYGAGESWTGAFRRPKPSRGPDLDPALLALAAAAPLFLVANGLAGRLAGDGLPARLAASAAVNAGVFAGLPLLLVWWRRWRPEFALAWRPPPAAAWLAAGICGFCAWPLAVACEQVGAAWFGPAFDLAQDPELKGRLEAFAEQLRQMPLAFRWLTFAAIPGVCEELFFRGLLFGALRRRGLAAALAGSSVAFAAFHVLGASALTPQRFLPTLFLGLLLGAMRQRSASVWPGMAFHVLHNGLLVWAAGKPQLLAKWLGDGDALRLPAGLLAGSAAALAAALGVLWLARGPRPEHAPEDCR